MRPMIDPSSAARSPSEDQTLASLTMQSTFGSKTLRQGCVQIASGICVVELGNWVPRQQRHGCLTVIDDHEILGFVRHGRWCASDEGPRNPRADSLAAGGGEVMVTASKPKAAGKAARQRKPREA
jgi:hypothetical protein